MRRHKRKDQSMTITIPHTELARYDFIKKAKPYLEQVAEALAQSSDTPTEIHCLTENAYKSLLELGGQLSEPELPTVPTTYCGKWILEVIKHLRSCHQCEHNFESRAGVPCRDCDYGSEWQVRDEDEWLKAVIKEAHRMTSPQFVVDPQPTEGEPDCDNCYHRQERSNEGQCKFCKEFSNHQMTTGPSCWTCNYRDRNGFTDQPCKDCEEYEHYE